MKEDLFNYIDEELERQRNSIELIASENFVSKDVLKCAGSILTNKYAEGYPGKRYYGGCQCVDKVESLAIDSVTKLFNCKYANVQPHSGAQANMAVYKALLNLGDTVMGLNLSDGGHLTHGLAANFSGKEYNIVSYGVDPQTGRIDYDDVEKKAMECKPKMIIAGATAYSRVIDFERFRSICDKCGAYLMVDMAHIAGLVAAGIHPSPLPYADVVTSTTHKTLRGPRGGIILTNNEDIIKKINKTIFPGLQGGPLMHIIAAKACAFIEASTPEFKEYANQIVKNCKAFAESLTEEGFKIIAGGTDNHVFLVDIKGSVGLTGKDAEEILDSVRITCNKNTIPGETESAFVGSGIRVGTAAMTTRGLKEEDFRLVGKLISKALKNKDNNEVLDEVREEVSKLTKKYPLYE